MARDTYLGALAMVAENDGVKRARDIQLAHNHRKRVDTPFQQQLKNSYLTVFIDMTVSEPCPSKSDQHNARNKSQG